MNFHLMSDTEKTIKNLRGQEGAENAKQNTMVGLKKVSQNISSLICTLGKRKEKSGKYPTTALLNCVIGRSYPKGKHSIDSSRFIGIRATKVDLGQVLTGSIHLNRTVSGTSSL